MKNFENLNTADEMIDAEVQKISAGSRNESNLLRLVFLGEVKNEIKNSWARMNSSRDREESQYIWRAISNEMNWLQTLLLQGKSIAMTSDVDKLKELKGTEVNIEHLQVQRDMTKASYYQGVKDYDRYAKEQEDFRKDGLVDLRMDMKTNEILEIVKNLNDNEKLAFWLEYFKLADSFIYTPQTQEVSKAQFGE